MQAPLRQLSRHMLPLSNPLGADVSFTAAVDRADVTVPATLVVPAGGRAELPIEWRPLLPKDGAATLTLQSAELGAFVYELALAALPAGSDKTLGFKVPTLALTLTLTLTPTLAPTPTPTPTLTASR